MIGKIISHYKILEELGRGGMGVVYKAEDTKLKRTVALKFLSADALEDEQQRARFTHEARSAAALDHPSICQVYEIDEAEGHTFISMAYVEGRNLRDRMESGPLDLDEAFRIITRVAKGLQAAHEKDIVHGDIKPANILLTADGAPKITDFGLARSPDEPSSQPGTTAGTAAYMSPEQLQGEEVDQRTDIWSLGAVFYEMITGRRAFPGDYEQAIVYSILNQDPEPIASLRPDAPRPLARVIDRALAKDPRDRYQDVDELLGDLQSIGKPDEKPPSGTVPLRKQPRRRKRVYLYPAISIVLILLLWMGLDTLRGRGAGIDSIAVLPLENLSGDPEQEYFADGMTEALITELSKIEALRVISRTSVMQYKGSDKSLPEIARDLKVDAIVEGSAMLAGDRVRITTQLIEASSDRHLWADNYERDLRDILSLQEEVARAVTREIRIALTVQDRARLAHAQAVHPQAYEAMLKGRFYLNKLTVESAREAITHFERAVEKDSGYALAYAGLAEAYDVLTSLRELPPHEGWPKVRAEATKALKLDPNLAEAHALLADVKFVYEWDWPGAEEEFRRAIELNPGYATAHHWYSLYLSAMGRHDEAVEEIDRALEIDPISLGAHVNAISVLFMARRYDEALEQAMETLTLDPDAVLPHSLLVELYLQTSRSAVLAQRRYDPGLLEMESKFTRGMDPDGAQPHFAEARLQKLIVDDAIAKYERALERAGMDPTIGLLRAYAVSGRVERAKALLAKLLEQRPGSYLCPYNIALAYGVLNENDRVFEWLEKARENRSMGLVFLRVNPRFDALRDDPRYRALLGKMGL